MLNNFFTIFSCYLRKIWLEFGADIPEIPLGQKRGKTSKLLRFSPCFSLNGFVYMWACFLYRFFSSLMFANKTCFCLHFERARFSGTNENASTLFATHTFFCLIFSYLFSSENRKRKANNWKIVKAFEKIHIKGRGLDVCYITNNVFWLFDCHFAPNSLCLWFFRVNFASFGFFLSLILLGLAWWWWWRRRLRHFVYVTIICFHNFDSFFSGGGLDLRRTFLWWNSNSGIESRVCVSVSTRAQKKYCCWWSWWLFSGEEIFALLSSSVFLVIRAP